MKILISFFCLVSLMGNAQTYKQPVQANLSPDYFISWYYYQNMQIQQKLAMVIKDKKRKIAIYKNQALNKTYSNKEIDSCSVFTYTLDEQNNPNDPYQVTKTTYKASVDFKNLHHCDYLINKDTLTAVGVFAFDNFKRMDFTFYISSNDLYKLLNKEELLLIKTQTRLLNTKQSNVVTLNYVKHSIEFGKQTFYDIERKLYNSVRNAKGNIYASDSLTRILSKKEIKDKMDYDLVVQVQVDPNDPYNLKDSVVRVVYDNYDSLEDNVIRYLMVYENGNFKILGVAPMFQPHAGGEIVPNMPIGFYKIEDVAKQIGEVNGQILKNTIWHSIMVKTDWKHYINSAFEDLKMQGKHPDNVHIYKHHKYDIFMYKDYILINK